MPIHRGSVRLTRLLVRWSEPGDLCKLVELQAVEDVSSAVWVWIHVCYHGYLHRYLPSTQDKNFSNNNDDAEDKELMFDEDGKDLEPHPTSDGLDRRKRRR